MTNVFLTAPHLASEWHPTRNDMLVTEANTRTVATWICRYNHEWEAVVYSRLNGRNCPYCAGKKVLPGFNDLATTHPEIAAQWHPELNNELTPEKVSKGSNKQVWWVCEQNHTWQLSVKKRTGNKTNCVYCSNKKVLPGFNDLATTHPEIAAEWHPELNSKYPTDLSAYSHEKVYLIGNNCGHVYKTQVSSRTVKGSSNCNICAGKITLAGETDLLSQHPEIASQWHPTQNGSFTPDKITSHSNHKIWWVCEENHEWQATVSDRVGKKYGCPECSSKKYSSQPENEMRLFLEEKGLTTVLNTRKVIHPHEIDIYIPQLNIGVEFNGVYWHSEAAGKNKHYHHDKWLAAKKAGVQLIQIWEDDWKRNPELIKRMLSHKTGTSQERTVYARKTSVVQIQKSEAELFLKSHHIQQHANGSYYIALKDHEKNETVAVLVLKIEPGSAGETLNIIRYATSANVVGGFTKLITHAERTYKPDVFITFADHCVSDGGLYENNGFVADKEIPPDYMYVVKSQRKHKFGYRLKKFKNDPNLKYEEGLTERELALLNNLPRVWDAGKTRYVKTITRHSAET